VSVNTTSAAMGKMRNAESEMWNQKCGMTLIGRGDKPRDRWLSAYYRTSLSTDSAVKCRTEVRKSLAMEADYVFLTMNPLCPIEL